VTTVDLPADEALVLQLLANNTYEEVQRRTGWSRGRIYALALRYGARKTEARIRERAAERRERQSQFLQQVVGTTVTADVLDYLDGIPDNSVQLGLTSVPYNLGKRYGGYAGADQMRFVYFHGWLMQVISEYSRILVPGGTLFLQVGTTRDWQDLLIPMDVLLFEDLRRAGLRFCNRVVWKLTQGVQSEDRLTGLHETALVFSKGPVQVFNPGAARTPQRHPGKRAYRGRNRGHLSGHPLGAHPSDVWDDIPTVRANHPDRRHGDRPAQFPLPLTRRAVMLYTLPGQLVCDAFNGSGTTHVACVATGRAFTGADLFYEDVRSRRLSCAVPDRSSTLPGVTDQSIAVWQAEARRVDSAARRLSPGEEQRLLLANFGAAA
jgi:DNA modification methylase